jgi:hypothetical protein
MPLHRILNNKFSLNDEKFFDYKIQTMLKFIFTRIKNKLLNKMLVIFNKLKISENPCGR